MAGLSPTGFDRKTLTEIVQDLKDSIKNEFGSTANVSDDSVFGQIVNGIFADRLDELWQALESVYNAWSVETAEGTQLDNLTSLVGITRNRSTRSGVDLLLTADNNTVISGAGTFIVETVLSKNRFRNVSGISINGSTGAVGGYITVNTVLDSTLYTVTLNGTVFSYTSDISATQTEILNGLQAAIALNSNFTSTVEGTQLRWDLVDKDQNVSYVVSSELTIAKVDVLLLMESVELGAILATAGDLTNIITPVSGIDSVTNLLSASLGTEEETDTELRIRTLLSLQNGGNGTLDTIRARLADLDGVNAVTVVENTSDLVDLDGRPPHSFEAIISHNGLPATVASIAQTIWDAKPLGIDSYGALSTTVLDSQGNTQTVYYSVPVNKDVYLRVEYTLYDEETFPVGGEAAIKDAVVEYGRETAELDGDLIPQRFFGKIYQNVSGIASLTVYIAIVDEGGPAPSFPADYSLTKVAIASNEVPVYNTSFVSVVDVT